MGQKAGTSVSVPSLLISAHPSLFRTLQAVNDDFLKISFDKFLKKWISHLTIGPNTDHVELCSNLIPYKPVYTGKKRTRKSMPEFIHICPFCLSYFLNSFGAFLHLQPDEWWVSFDFFFFLNPVLLRLIRFILVQKWSFSTYNWIRKT